MIFSLYRQFVIFSDFLIKTTIYVIETGTYIVAFVTGRLLLKTTRFTKEVFFILTSISSRKKSTNGQADFPVGNCLFEHTSQKGSIMVITFSSMKGGVGKSTDAILLANNLAARGYKVLFFDMDTNNSSTIYYCMGIADEFPTQNVAEALTHRTTEGYTVKSRIENVDIVPSTLRLFDIRSIDYHALKKCLPTDKYDYIIIDTAPTYDNLVMNALYASDYIFTPVQLDYFNLTTSKCLRSHLYDELNEKVDNWYIYYTFWQENLALFPDSIQSQFANVFEQEFDNILDIQLPNTPATRKYTQTDEKVSVHSRMLGSQRLALAFNKLANLITGKEADLEKF